MGKPIPEPWMFGVTVEVDGQPIEGSIGRFTPAARLRFAWRRLTRQPELRCTKLGD